VRAPLVSAIPITHGMLRALAAREPKSFPVFLDSAAKGPLARFSLLAFEPRARLSRDARGALGGAGVALGGGGFLDNLDAWFRRERQPRHHATPNLPFAGGWLVYLGYEMAAEIEPRLALPAAHTPYSAIALRVEHFALHDARSGQVFAVSENGDAAAHARLVAGLESAASGEEESTEPLALAAIDEDAPERFLEQVRRAQEFIAAGDIYQANLSRAWRLRLRDGVQPWQIYGALRRANPAPFAASWTAGFTVHSSSPERLLRIEGKEISTRPIAGTRARTGDAAQDARDTAELISHPKERAEHVMLIDLERNDLGRVCEAGSVKVDEYMVTESYAHVHHIVSNVRGTLRADRSPVDALRALFPGGTITGCPKVRCMEVIAQLEGTGRGAYTGSLGWLGTDGDADFNILIRTLTVDGRDVELRAGAGIVADSVPERELEETRAKARGLLRAFGDAR
jgi:anthranilate synthase component 1